MYPEKGLQQAPGREYINLYKRKLCFYDGGLTGQSRTARLL
jgi:hypothetical protein